MRYLQNKYTCETPIDDIDIQLEYKSDTEYNIHIINKQLNNKALINVYIYVFDYEKDTLYDVVNIPNVLTKVLFTIKAKFIRLKESDTMSSRIRGKINHSSMTELQPYLGLYLDSFDTIFKEKLHLNSIGTINCACVIYASENILFLVQYIKHFIFKLYGNFIFIVYHTEDSLYIQDELKDIQELNFELFNSSENILLQTKFYTTIRDKYKCENVMVVTPDTLITGNNMQVEGSWYISPLQLIEGYKIGSNRFMYITNVSSVQKVLADAKIPVHDINPPLALGFLGPKGNNKNLKIGVSLDLDPRILLNILKNLCKDANVINYNFLNDSIKNSDDKLNDPIKNSDDKLNDPIKNSDDKLNDLIKNSDNKIQQLLLEYDKNPNNLGLYHSLLNTARIKGLNHVCRLLYESKRKELLALPENNTVSNIMADAMIFLYYTGVRDVDDELMYILKNNSDSLMYNDTLRNYMFYVKKLNSVSNITLDSQITVNIDGKSVPLTSTSHCMIPVLEKPNVCMLNIRYVNYKYVNNRINVFGFDRIVNVQRYILINTITWEKYEDKQFLIDENEPAYKDKSKLEFGIQDLKIFRNSIGNIVFIGNNVHSDSKIGTVIGDYDIKQPSLISKEIKQKFKQTNCEKNWVYVNHENTTKIIYCWYPLTVCQIEGNELQILDVKKPCMVFKHIRGSTCGVRHGDEYWFIVHSVIAIPERHYFHYIVVLNLDLEIVRFSAPFKFENEPIEYALSINVSNEEVMVNYSIWDCKTRIGIYDKTYIDSLLVYTP